MIKLEQLRLELITAEDVRNEFIYYQSQSADHRYQMAEDEEFYLGKQLTTEQKDFLVSVNQPVEANNKIRPAVEQVLSNVASSSPIWQAIPVGKVDDAGVTYVYSVLMDDIWDKSRGNTQYRGNCKDYTVKGRTHLFVYPDWQAENGLGAVRMMRMKPGSVFISPDSSLEDASDAVSIIYSDLHTKTSLKLNYPEYADQIEKASEDADKNAISTGKYSRDSVTTEGDYEGDVRTPKSRKYIRWSKVSVPKVRVTDMATGKTKVYNDKEYAELIADPRYKEFVNLGLLKEKLVKVPMVRETFVVSDQLLYDEVLPLTRYPLVTAYNEFAGTPYSSGDVRHAKAPQRMLNRTEHLIIAHTASQSGNKPYYEEGAMDASEVAKMYIPNAPVKVNPGALSGKNKKIHFQTYTSPPNELYNQKAKYELDIETVFGAYKFQQGNPAGAPGTVGEAQIIDEAVARKQNWKMLPVYDMLTEAARVAIEWIPHVYDQQRVLRMVNPAGDPEEIVLNKLQIDDRTGDVKRIYDVTTARVDIRVVIGSTRAKSPQAELQSNLVLLNSQVYDLQEVIQRLPGDVDKASLLQRRGEINQLQATIKQLEEKIKKLTGDMQTREREIYHSNLRAEIAEATKPVAEAVARIKSKIKLEEQRQADLTQLKSKELAESKTVNSKPEAPKA